jgi:hypothetical protein
VDLILGRTYSWPLPLGLPRAAGPSLAVGHPEAGCVVIGRSSSCLSRTSRLRGVWTRRLRCAGCVALDDPLADGLIWVVAAMGVPGSKCARSAHSLALDQERLGEPQRV